jgi:hypothetical protein
MRRTTAKGLLLAKPFAATVLTVHSRIHAGGRRIRFHLTKRWSWIHAVAFNGIVVFLKPRHDICNERTQFSGGYVKESF